MNNKASITFGSCSDVGMVRHENQDYYGKFPEDTLDVTSPKGQLFIVADGMGGHEGGREASEMAVQSIQEAFFSDPTEPITESLRKAFAVANANIYEFSMVNPRFMSMGTTCSALVVKDNHGYIGHIGDSRIYRITESSIAQLTDDHSKVAEMQRRGIITKEEAKYHPERSQLYRAVGVRPAAEGDVMNNIELHANEYFLLCTDGLVNFVEDNELKDVVLSHEPQEACEALVALANQRGGSDNITAIVVRIGAIE